jgi:hypothetical protein
VKNVEIVGDDEFYNYVVSQGPTYATEPTKDSLAFWRSFDRVLVGYINYGENGSKQFTKVTYKEDGM